MGVNYRKPIAYIPPYNYCNRECGRCAIDKSRCLLYQTEMDERLHREIDGLGEPTAEEMVERIMVDARKALRMVEEQAREMGFDPGEDKRGAGELPSRKPGNDPIVEEATLLARGTAAFVRDHGGDFPEEMRVLRRSFLLVAPKLGRATMDAIDSLQEADAILQAQVAHRSLAEMASTFDGLRRRYPALADAMLDLLALIQRLRVGIERRWLSKPSDHLEPVTSSAWWGPLRDITPTLKHFRR